MAPPNIADTSGYNLTEAYLWNMIFQAADIAFNARFNGSTYNMSDILDAMIQDEYTNKHIEVEVTTSEMLFYSVLWTYVAPAIFGTICIIGVVGNLLVIYVILSQKEMRTDTNFLLLNLAISDITFLIITVPFTAYKYVAFSWPFGDVFCKLVQYSLYVGAYVTVWTLVAISVYRYLYMIHSGVTAQYRTKRNVVFSCLAIWCLVLSTQTPVLLAHTTKHVDSYSYCGIKDGVVETVFVTFFVFAYVLPLIIICLLYLLVGKHLHKHESGSQASNRHTNRRMAKATRVLILVVIVFSISWLPLHINSLVATYGTLPKGAWYEVFRILWHCMAYGNSCINPVIYSCASEGFRKAFKEILCCNVCVILRKKYDAKSESELKQMVEPTK